MPHQNLWNLFWLVMTLWSLYFVCGAWKADNKKWILLGGFTLGLDAVMLLLNIEGIL